MIKTARLALLLLLVLALMLAGCQQQPATETVDPATPPTAAPQPTNTPSDGQPTATPAPPTATASPEEPYPMPTLDLSQPTSAYPEPVAESEPETSIIWQADGQIRSNEYNHERVVDKMTIWWANDS